MEQIRLVRLNHKTEGNKYFTERFGFEKSKKVNAFHRSFPEYSVTPLADLKELARMAGVAGIHVKDESWRFGLNAFKVLGGSYAIGSYIAGRLGMDISGLSCGKMLSSEIRKRLGDITFVTATDGNHGRGVAWTANRLKQKSVVYMPECTAAERLDNIRKLGSDAAIMDMPYDDCVRLARENADKFEWVLIQDTSWEGYEEIPSLIMEGYTTIGYEIVNQMQGVKPTHVFLQAGVGSMAAALAAFCADFWKGSDKPVITIVEPEGADCIFRTAQADDGTLHTTRENMHSIMAGLCCGEPCTVAWDILKDYADFFVSMPDYVAAKGMRVLANPLPGDPKVVSGESGASTSGLVAEILFNKDYSALKEELGIDADSQIVCISTEGATDRENYRRIVWDGLYPSF